MEVPVGAPNNEVRVGEEVKPLLNYFHRVPRADRSGDAADDGLDGYQILDDDGDGDDGPHSPLARGVLAPTREEAVRMLAAQLGMEKGEQDHDATEVGVPVPRT